MATPDRKRIADLNFLFVCEHAFIDSEGKPCLIGIIEDVVPKTAFPLWYAKLTLAIHLRAEPKSVFEVKVQFGPRGDIMRDGRFTVEVHSRGTVLIPFNMVHVRFDVPGDYEARVIVDDEVLMPIRTIKVRPTPIP